MTPGEVSTITSSSQYAYDGRADRPATVPLGAKVEWEVELISFEQQQDWERAEPDVKITHAGIPAVTIGMRTSFEADMIHARMSLHGQASQCLCIHEMAVCKQC